MKRREFFLNFSAAAAFLSVPFISSLKSNNKVKIGILSQMISFYGQSEFEKPENVVSYPNFKTAYRALLEKEIDVLISSPEFLSQFNPEFKVLGLPVQNQNNSAWLKESYNFASAFHSNYGLSSELVGQFSPLMIRISDLHPEELGKWKSKPGAFTVVASGLEAVNFEHMGFRVRNEIDFLRLTRQVVDLRVFLNLTGAYSPALFLNAYLMNTEISVPYLSSSHHVMKDDCSKAPMAVEIISRQDSESLEAVRAIKPVLENVLVQNTAVQEAALQHILELPNYFYYNGLPLTLVDSIQSYQKLYVDELKNLKNVNLDLINKYELYRG